MVKKNGTIVVSDHGGCEMWLIVISIWLGFNFVLAKYKGII